MFREGIHRARFKHRWYTTWFDGILEYVSDSRIYLYTNSIPFNGTKSDNFKKNSYGYMFCFHTSTHYLDDVIYIDYKYIGEL